VRLLLARKIKKQHQNERKVEAVEASKGCLIKSGTITTTTTTTTSLPFWLICFNKLSFS
jgi:ornithine cyclodeaminase/alanine dehydrogenase-like protein (mu-crystallin family)